MKTFGNMKSALAWNSEAMGVPAHYPHTAVDWVAGRRLRRPEFRLGYQRVSAAGMRASSLQGCIHGVTLRAMKLCQCTP